MYSALVTFIRKFSSALAIFFVSQVIGWAGYIPPLQQTVDGATSLVDQTQTATFILVLRLIFLLLPVILLALALIFALRFPLTPELHRRLNAVLSQRKNEPVDEDENEKKDLRETIDL